ncbi:MAG: hypothetical protein J6V25_10010 [Oscillospiraceae bacterium]|nr:hypothetical protein [Oscillospiraceae bacterium]
MEKENQISEDIYDQEEKCQKAIRTVGKAILMRLVVAVLMIWVVIRNPEQVWAWGMMAFVMLINGLGAVPLVQEWLKQKKRLAELIDMEE